MAGRCLLAGLPPDFVLSSLIGGDRGSEVGEVLLLVVEIALLYLRVRVCLTENLCLVLLLLSSLIFELFVEGELSRVGCLHLLGEDRSVGDPLTKLLSDLHGYFEESNCRYYREDSAHGRCEDWRSADDRFHSPAEAEAHGAG